MNSESLYRDILLRAWNTTKNNAHFWILGFFVALLGNSGEFEFILMQFKKLSSGYVNIGEGFVMAIGTGGSNFFEFLVKIFENIHQNLFISLLFAGILALFVWLAVSCQGALVRVIALSSDLKGARLRDHFLAGSSSFFSLLGIVLTTRLAAFIIIAVIGIPLASLLIYFVDPLVASALVFFVVGMPLLIISSLIAKYAIAYHMLDRKSWKSSISNALQLFADNWLISIELAVIVFVINILAGAMIILLILLFSIPFILLTYLLQDNYQNTAIILLWVGEIVAFGCLILFGSILATFQYASWTELFLKIRKGGHLSKIMRLVMSVRDKYR